MRTPLKRSKMHRNRKWIWIPRRFGFEEWLLCQAYDSF